MLNDRTEKTHLKIEELYSLINYDNKFYNFMASPPKKKKISFYLCQYFKNKLYSFPKAIPLKLLENVFVEDPVFKMSHNNFF